MNVTLSRPLSPPYASPRASISAASTGGRRASETVAPPLARVASQDLFEPPVSHLTLHPTQAVTITIDEREVATQLWGSFSKAATTSFKKGALYRFYASHQMNQYVRQVLSEDRTQAVKAQVGKIHVVSSDEDEQAATQSHKWLPSCFTSGSKTERQASTPPVAPTANAAASSWALLGRSIFQETKKLSPHEAATDARTQNAESMVHSWIARAQGFLKPDSPVAAPQQAELTTWVERLHNRWHPAKALHSAS